MSKAAIQNAAYRNEDAAREALEAVRWPDGPVCPHNEIGRWQAGDAQLLAVQIDAGGEGVDLARARYSIFFSVGFSLGKYEQAKARTHRPGQNKPVTHIHLVARNTVDQKIMRALEKRAEVVQSILAEIKN